MQQGEPRLWPLAALTEREVELVAGWSIRQRHSQHLPNVRIEQVQQSTTVTHVFWFNDVTARELLQLPLGHVREQLFSRQRIRSRQSQQSQTWCRNRSNGRMVPPTSNTARASATICDTKHSCQPLSKRATSLAPRGS